MILFSVIYHNALPVTKKSDNNICMCHYIQNALVLKKSKESEYRNILKSNILTPTAE